MGAPRILVVDDESAIADTIVYALRTEGMNVHHCLLGGEAITHLRESGAELVVLDIGLPDQSGFEVFRAIRAFSGVPIIFLTARSAEIDTVVGLEMGADDYIAKPFSPRELAARIRVVLRRTQPPVPRPEVEAGLRLDLEGARAVWHGERLDLTRYEFLLLAALAGARGRILSRARLMDDVWGDDSESFDRTVDAHVKTLRAKLRAITPECDPIRTHRGMGYAFDQKGG